MKTNELDALKTLAQQLLVAPTIVKISDRESDSTESILDARDDALVFTVDPDGRHHPHNPKVIKILGDGLDVGLFWSFPVDMILVSKGYTQETLRTIISRWKGAVVHGGIIAFYHYDSDEYPDVKIVVDESMAEYEQICYVDALVAYKMVDPTTVASWQMLEQSYERHAVVQ